MSRPSLRSRSLIFAGRGRHEPEGVLPRLSLAALQYAQALEMDDVGQLSSRLYFYNRIPVTPAWSRQLQSEEAVAEFLGISRSANRRLLAQAWDQSGPSNLAGPWFRWRSKRVASPDPYWASVYKLYISPSPAALPKVFPAVVDILSTSSAHAFKIGSTPAGLLRPDKWIAYFAHREMLLQTAAEIASALPGCAAHGVPFSAAIGNTGLLSWGVDLALDQSARTSDGAESWRLWITSRLAVALVSARNGCGGVIEPWQFALDRIRLQNIDTDTWSPTEKYGLSA